MPVVVVVKDIATGAGDLRFDSVKSDAVTLSTCLIYDGFKLALLWACCCGLDVVITFLNYDFKNLIVMQKAHINWTCGRGNCRQRLTTAVMFLRSCVVQALNRGSGSRHSLHASV